MKHSKEKRTINAQVQTDKKISSLKLELSNIFALLYFDLIVYSRRSIRLFNRTILIEQFHRSTIFLFSSVCFSKRREQSFKRDYFQTLNSIVYD